MQQDLMMSDTCEKCVGCRDLQGADERFRSAQQGSKKPGNLSYKN